MKSFLGLIALLVFTAASLAAGLTDRITSSLSSGLGTEDMVIDADVFTTDLKSGWVTAKGHVHGKTGDHELFADRARINRTTGEVVAAGHVRINRGALGCWTGESLEYNYKTGEGMTGFGEFRQDPFRIQMEEAKITRAGEYQLNRVALTTCTNAPGCWHWSIRGDARLLDGEYVGIEHAVPYFFGIPFGYIPWAYRAMGVDYGIRVYPGYTSRWGGYVLLRYKMPFACSEDGRYRLDGTTMFDVRTRAGVAAGEDFEWDLDEWGRGRFLAYYAYDTLDKNDLRGHDHNWSSDVEHDRYILGFEHRADLTPRDQFIIHGRYLSDSQAVSDFFRHEAYQATQLRNYATLEHRENAWAAGAQVSGPLNDFYDGVARLPELWVSAMPRPLPLGTIYEGQSRAGYLVRKYGKYGKARPEFAYTPGIWADYEALRLDTAHRLTRPMKFFDVLSVVPRVGYHGTFYGKAADDHTLYRNAAEAGVEVSARATSLWHDDWRHVFEPYVDYSWQPESFAHGDRRDVYYFDRFDRSTGWLDRFGRDGAWLPYSWHGVRPGFRNLFQTRDAEGDIRTVLDIDTFAVVQAYCSNSYEDGKGLVAYGTKLEYQPTEDLDFLFHGEFDPNHGTVPHVDISAFTQLNDQLRMGVTYVGRDYDIEDYRKRLIREFNCRKDNFIYGGFTWNPVDAWGFSPYLRWDAMRNELDEVGVDLRYRLDCIVFQLSFSYEEEYERIDGSTRDDDFSVRFSMWLRAGKGREEDPWRTW